jgi:hypothetical protein
MLTNAEIFTMLRQTALGDISNEALQEKLQQAQMEIASRLEKNNGSFHPISQEPANTSPETFELIHKRPETPAFGSSTFTRKEPLEASSNLTTKDFSPATTAEVVTTPEISLSPTSSLTLSVDPSTTHKSKSTKKTRFGQNEIITYDINSTPALTGKTAENPTDDIGDQTLCLARQLSGAIDRDELKQANEIFNDIKGIVKHYLTDNLKVAQIETKLTPEELKNKIKTSLDKRNYPNALLFCIRLLFSSPSENNDNLALYKKITGNTFQYLQIKKLNLSASKAFNEISCLREHNPSKCLTRTLNWQDRYSKLQQQANGENNQELQRYSEKQLAKANNLLSTLQQGWTHPHVEAQHKATVSPNNPLTSEEKTTYSKHCITQCNVALKKLDRIMETLREPSQERDFYQQARDTIQNIKSERLDTLNIKPAAKKPAAIKQKNAAQIWRDNNPYSTYTTPRKTGSLPYVPAKTTKVAPPPFK